MNIDNSNIAKRSVPNFKSIRIRLASPEQILAWSHGEVTRAETINYRTQKPEPDGLFCLKIFGPQKNYECGCGKLHKNNAPKGPDAKPEVCPKCKVEITTSDVRRTRMGHIKLETPIAHIWYFKNTQCCYLKLLLDIKDNLLDKIIYYSAYVVVDPGCLAYADPQEDPRFGDGKTIFPIKEKDVLSETDYEICRSLARKKMQNAPQEGETDADGNEYKNYKMPDIGMGAEAIQKLLMRINLPELKDQLRAELADCTAQRRINLQKRLAAVEAFIKSGNKPEWMILTYLPVIPPELRPMVQLEGGRYASSDLNDLYRRVINRNQRLKKFKDSHAPAMMIKNEQRMLQEAVDELIDNEKHGNRPITGGNKRPLKSLTSLLKGKQGRFRQNLLGKRVDYSGRSVIVVGPELKLFQCGLPKEMARELFMPFIMKELIDDSKRNGQGHELNLKTARAMVTRGEDQKVWDALEKVIKGHPVLLNRAPTLHRLGIQAFEPVLVEGRALKLHPLACTAYNADFDGDQMAVHVPLSIEAQAEARFLMLAANNILKPQDGNPVISPTQDMVLGCFYLTGEREGAKGEGSAYCSMDEAVMAYQTGNVTLQSSIYVRINRTWNGTERQKLIKTTVGRLIFNEAIPQDLGYVDRSVEDNLFKLEIDFQVGKKDLGRIVSKCYTAHGPTETCEVLDRIKALGYKYSTRGGISLGYQDVKVPAEKAGLIAEAEKQVMEIEGEYGLGLLSVPERRAAIIKIWEDTTESVKKALLASFDKYNPVSMMAKSGARGSDDQIKQLAGMRGVMADTNGQTIEVPIRSSFREGLNVLEFFVSSHGARKGLADTALRTADSGYLTRRLVDVSHDVIVREIDCMEGAKVIDGTELSAIVDPNSGKEVEPFGDRILGRYTTDAVLNPETGEVIVEKNGLITHAVRDRIVKAGYTKLKCRSVFTCKAEHGVCAKCYGSDLTTGRLVDIGEAVGVIAAQAIGEPGTQLTMRTFHTGGVASTSDITQGLPRVEEIFEARNPKGNASLSEIPGVVSIDKSEQGERKVIVTPLNMKITDAPLPTTRKRSVSKTDKDQIKIYPIAYGSKLRVEEGQTIPAGEPLTEGPVNPHDMLRICGRRSVQCYMLAEVQKVYRSQGVEIADKHIEIIISQLMRKVKIESSGDTTMLPGELVEITEYNNQNDATVQSGNTPANCSAQLLGLTRAALAKDSFLSAASFQETMHVLAEAAIKGKEDHLVGLKENIIVGKLIPAGLGLPQYRDIDVYDKRKVNNAAAEDVPAPAEDLASQVIMPVPARIVDKISDLQAALDLNRANSLANDDDDDDDDEIDDIDEIDDADFDPDTF